jgi:hypothetical protein
VINDDDNIKENDNMVDYREAKGKECGTDFLLVSRGTLSVLW